MVAPDCEVTIFSDSIAVFTRGDNYEYSIRSFKSLGNDDEFMEYVNKINVLGIYPSIAKLLETYAFCDRQEPGPLIDECEKLLAREDIASDVKKIMLDILDTAQDAKMYNTVVGIEIEHNDSE